LKEFKLGEAFMNYQEKNKKEAKKEGEKQ